MSKLDRIASFIAVVEENGFAAAARKYDVSTAAISRQISRLESDLNAELLLRTPRRIALTELGAEYYQRCKKAIHELSEAEASIISSQKEATGTLSVMSSRYFAIECLIPHLPEFMARNPKLHIKIELAERFPNLGQENIDLIFGVSLGGGEDLVRKRISMTRYVLCASPDYLKQYGTPQSPKELTQHRYITHSMRVPENVITFKDNKEIYIEPVLALNDSRAMRECAILGIGIVKLHECIVADALKSGKLVEVLHAFQEPEMPVYLYYQQSKYLQPKIRQFIDFYTANISKKI